MIETTEVQEKRGPGRPLGMKNRLPSKPDLAAHAALAEHRCVGAYQALFDVQDGLHRLMELAMARDSGDELSELLRIAQAAQLAQRNIADALPSPDWHLPAVVLPELPELPEVPQ